MKNKFTIFLPIITALFTFTPSQHTNQLLNLDGFNLNFNIESYYAPSIKKAKLYREQRDAILNGKDEKEFGGKLVDAWSFETISIDSIFMDDDHSHKPIGLQYNMKSWTAGDSLARFGNMYFDAVHMMSSSEGKFMALVATNQSEDEKSFKELLSVIEKKYGRAEIKEEEFFGQYYTYRWQLKDRILAVSSKYNDKSNELKIAVDLNNNSVDTTKHLSIDSKLFILSNNFKDSAMGSLKCGSWLYFDRVLEN